MIVGMSKWVDLRGDEEPLDTHEQAKKPTVAGTLLAVIAGLTLPTILAPGVYWLYFYSLGWPSPLMTHSGPLWGTPYADFICFGTLTVLLIFPVATLVLAAVNHRAQRARNPYYKLIFLLPVMQMVCSAMNLLAVVMLVE
jgi:hypothetical protein